MEDIGYPTSKNRRSMGISLTPEQMQRLTKLAERAGMKKAPFVQKLIDLEWSRQQRDTEPQPTEQAA